MKFRTDAYSIGAVVEGGVPYAVARRLVADGPRAVPERPRLSIHGRKRGEPTREYVWGPDANTLLAEPAQQSK